MLTEKEAMSQPAKATPHSPTPTPWTASEGPKDEQPSHGISARHPGKPDKKFLLGVCFDGFEGEGVANAAFIVRAVNNFEYLLLAAKSFRDYLKLDGRPSTDLDNIIAKAEGKL
jgi:hypothetical protein